MSLRFTATPLILQIRLTYIFRYEIHRTLVGRLLLLHQPLGRKTAGFREVPTGLSQRLNHQLRDKRVVVNRLAFLLVLVSAKPLISFYYLEIVTKNHWLIVTWHEFFRNRYRKWLQPRTSSSRKSHSVGEASRG